MKRLIGLASAFTCALALVSCANSQGKFTPKTTAYDDGTLSITTAPPQLTRIGPGGAEYEFAHSYGSSVGSTSKPAVLAYVTVKPSVTQAAPSRKVPMPSHRLSWVIFYMPGVSACGAFPPSPPHFTAARPSRILAMIVDATTGTARTYQGAGSGNCSQLASPMFGAAGGYVSVPWTDSGSTYVTATYPACVRPTGSIVSQDSTGTTIEVRGGRSFEPCNGTSSTGKITILFKRPWKHAPVGAVLGRTNQVG
jgi:hypothetical protein